MPGDNLNKIFKMRRATFHLTKKGRREYGIAEFISKEQFLSWSSMMKRRGYGIDLKWTDGYSGVDGEYYTENGVKVKCSKCGWVGIETRQYVYHHGCPECYNPSTETEEPLILAKIKDEK